MIGAAHYMAGMTMEYGGDPMEALRHYISAYTYGTAPGLAPAIARLADVSIFAGRQEVRDARAELGLTDDAPPPIGLQPLRRVGIIGTSYVKVSSTLCYRFVKA